MDDSQNELLNPDKFFKGLSEIDAPLKEQTFFSIGGRGYFENPTSDLLAFFMSDGDHGLKEYFLGAFLHCIGIGDLRLREMLCEPIFIERESKTEKGNRLDLRIRGKDWALIIENKVRHWLANDFLDYKTSSQIWAARYGITKDNLKFSILSPDGYATDDKSWIPVSYHDFIEKTREILDITPITCEYSKWYIFAKDFLLHIQQEVCMSSANNKIIDFVDSNLENLAKINRIKNDYMHYMHRQLLDRLASGLQHPLQVSWEKSYFWIMGSNWKVWQLGLSGPDHMNTNSTGKLIVRIWRSADPTEIDLNPNQSIPGGYKQVEMVGPYAEFQKNFSSAREAINEVCMLAETLLVASNTIVAEYPTTS